LSVAAAALLIGSSCAAQSDPSSPAETFAIHDFTPDFWRFWEAATPGARCGGFENSIACIARRGVSENSFAHRTGTNGLRQKCAGSRTSGAVRISRPPVIGAPSLDWAGQNTWKGGYAASLQQ